MYMYVYIRSGNWSNTYSHVVCVSLCEIEQVAIMTKDFDLVQCISDHEVMFANNYYFPHPSLLSFFIRLSWIFWPAISDRSAVASCDLGSLPRESSPSEAMPDVPVGSGCSKIVEIYSVRIKFFPPGYSHSLYHSLCRLEGIFTKIFFTQIDMLRQSIPTIASSPHLPNPLLPTVVIAQEFKNADSATQVLLHPAATQFLTILCAISLFLREGRKRAMFL